MSPSDLALYTNIGLIVLFVLICLGVFFAAVRGYKKGIFHTTYKVLFFVVLFGIGLFTFEPIVHLIGNINLSFLPWKTVIITSPDATATAYIPITTLFETLENSLAAFGLFYNYTGSVAEVVALGTALATTIIKSVTFIIMMVLILTLGVLLRMLLWHLIFKRFVPKAVYKTVKLPWISMVENATKFVVIGFLFLSPFTSMVNILNQAHQRNKIEQEQTEVVEYLTATLDAYNNSVFASTFFNWTASDDGVTFDVEIFDLLTKTTIENGSISLIGEIQNLSDLGYTLFVTMFKDGKVNLADLTGGLTADMIQTIFATLRGSPTIMYLLPMAIEIVMNSNLLEQYIDVGLIEISDMKWEEELRHVEYMLCDIAESGILNMFLDENGEFIAPDTTMLIESLFSKESYPYICSLFERIDQSKLLTRAICALVNTLDLSIEGETLLPSSWDEINEIRWGIELKTVYSCLYRVTQYSPDLIDYIMTNVNQPKASHGVNNASTGVFDTKELITIIVDCLPILKEVLIGSTDSKGQPLYVDSHGRTIVYDENGKKIAGREYCLADSNLFKYMLPSLSKMLVSALPNDDIDFSAVEKAVEELNRGEIIFNYKREFGVILKALEPLADSKEALDLISNFDKIDSPTDITVGAANALGDCLIILDNSQILSTAVKDFVKTLLTTGEIADTLLEFGLDASKFNFDNVNFGYEVAKLLKMFPDVAELYRIYEQIDMKDAATMLSSLAKVHLSIANVLDAILSNQIINPDELNNEPFLNALQAIFSNAELADLGLDINLDDLPKDIQWVNTRDINGNIITDKYGNPIYTGETGKIANCIKVIGESGIIKVLDEDITKNIGKLESEYHISSIIKVLASSEIFKLALPSFLDKQIEETDLIDPSLEMSFHNVSDWNLEADNFGKLLLAIDELGLDFSNLDFTALTTDQNISTLNKLLHLFENSQIFDNGTDNCFSSFLYSKLKDALNTSNIDIFADPVVEGQPKTYEIFKTDMESITTDDWSNDEYWINGEFHGDNDLYYECDELGKLCNIIKKINDADLMNMDFSSIDFENPPFTSETLSDVLLSVNNAKPFRIVVYNMFNTISTNVDAQAFSLKSANNEYLLYPETESGNTQEDIDARAIEIGYLINLYDVFVDYSGTILSGGTFDISLIDSDFVAALEDILIDLNQSYVYHRAGIDETKYELTVFQNLLDAFIGTGDMSSMFYSENSPKDYYYYKNLGINSASEKQAYLLDTIFPAGESVTDYDSQEQEILNITEVLKAFIGAEDGSGGYYSGVFVKNPDNTFGPQFNFGSDIFYVSGDRTDPRDPTKTVPVNNVLGLQQVLETLQYSELLKDCSPNAIGNALNGTISGAMASGSYINMGHINTYYIYYDGTTFNWDNTYDADEIEFLTYLIQQMANYIDGNDETISDIPSDFAKIGKDDLPRLNNFLDQIANSKLMHLGGPAYSVNADGSVNFVNNSDGYPSTFYQDIYLEILNMQGIHEYYYSTNSPKDNALYSQGLSYKIQKAVVESQLNYLDESINYEDVNGGLINVFDTLFDTLNLTDLTSFSGFDVAEIDTSKLYNLLTALDKNDILYDMVPNILNEAFESLSSNSSFNAFGRVTFENLNPYYLYDIYTSQPDYSIRYGDDLSHDELYAITTIIDTSIGQDGVITALNEKMGGSITAGDLTLSILTDDIMIKLDMFLNALHDSYITHREHPNYFHGTIAELDSYIDSLETIENRALTLKGTVFEEFIVTFLDVLHLSDFAFDVDQTLNQTGYYGVYNADSNTAGHVLKSIHEIKRLSIYEAKLDSDYKGINTSWKNFIDSFMLFVGDFRDFMNDIGKTDFNITESDLVNIAPTELIKIIAEMNGLDVVHEASNRLIRTLYQQMNFSQMTTLDDGTNAYDVANYYIGQELVGYVNEETMVFTGELNALNDFLSEFYIPGTGYADMENLIDLNTITPETFENILNFLSESNVYSVPNQFSNNQIGYNGSANGFVFGYIASPILNYLTGEGIIDSMETASYIFARPDYSASDEANNVIRLYAASLGLTYADLDDTTSLLTNSYVINQILESSIATNSLFTKDVAANILDNVVDTYETALSGVDKGSYVKTTYAPSNSDAVKTYGYNTLGQLDVNGFKGASYLSMHLYSVYNYSTLQTKFNSDLSLYGETYTVKNLFDLMNIAGENSYVACLIYQEHAKAKFDYAPSVSVENIFLMDQSFSSYYNALAFELI